MRILFRRPLQHGFLYLLSLVLLLSYASLASADDELRVRNGLKMFRSILSADQDIRNKHNKNQAIDIVFLYSGELERAEKHARKFVRMGRGEKKGRIKDMPILIHLARDLSGIEKKSVDAAGLFILSPLDPGAISGIVEYGKKHNIVTYSPFEGDVEQGILSGLTIDTRPKPYINAQVMNASGVRFKSFFLRVAKVYDPAR